MYINRAIEKEITSRLFKGKAIIIFGPRQTGKSTLVEKILENRQEKILKFNGDDYDVRELLNKTNSTKLKNIVAGNRIVFIDEAQRIPDIGLTLKIFTDTIKDIQVIATGSSAFELGSKINEPLTGRKYEFMLYPFSYEETSSYYGLMEEKRLIEQRLIFGCYPEIVTNPQEAKDLLKWLAGSYLYKDLLSIEQINKPLLLEKILRALALQLGSEVKYTEIAQLVGADKETVEKYIHFLEKAFVVFCLPALNRNVRNEIKKGKKIYFWDNGIRNAIIGNFNFLASRTDTGALWENYLVAERIKLLNYKRTDARKFFWRTQQQQEIDYIEEREGKYFAYEFKWNPKTKVGFSKTFIENYPVESTMTVTPDNVEEFLLV